VNTSSHNITVSGLDVEVVRKDIRHLHLAVYPPKGRVRVAAPTHVTDEHVRLAVVSRLPWIRKRQKGFREQARQSARQYVTGESHYCFGKTYRLEVDREDRRPRIEFKNATTLLLHVPENEARSREQILTEWYRQQLKEAVAPLVEKWASVVGVEIRDWRVRRMKTRWGSCNADAGRIWLNLELAKKPMRCIEYILVHETIHLLERRHNATFVAYMDKYLPSWRSRRRELNSFPVSHEGWDSCPGNRTKHMLPTRARNPAC
jgi:predicted metal-dependent hydrolase